MAQAAVAAGALGARVPCPHPRCRFPRIQRPLPRWVHVNSQSEGAADSGVVQMPIFPLGGPPPPVCSPSVQLACMMTSAFHVRGPCDTNACVDTSRLEAHCPCTFVAVRARLPTHVAMPLACHPANGHLLLQRLLGHGNLSCKQTGRRAGMVALPGSEVPLQIFEARYRVLFHTLLSGSPECDPLPLLPFQLKH